MFPIVTFLRRFVDVSIIVTPLNAVSSDVVNIVSRGVVLTSFSIMLFSVVTSDVVKCLI